MKRILIPLIFAIIFLFICGCMEPTPEKNPVTTVTTLATSATYLPTTSIPTLEKTPSVSDNTITIKKTLFSPTPMTVKAGATVRWVNVDSTDDPALYSPVHRIQFADRTLSPVLSPGQSWSKIFDHAGVYDYTCAVHPSLQGTLIVE